MVSSGERSGTLALSLLEAADQLEEEYLFSRKIRGSLFYPCLLLIVAFIIVYTASSVILPMYSALFQEMNAQLPVITVMLIHVGRNMPYGLILLFLLGLWHIRKNKKNGFWLLPGTRQIQKTRSLLQFCAILSKFLRAGITLLESLILLSRFSSPKELTVLTEKLINAVREGERIAPLLENSCFFPEDAAKMVGIGEESGQF
jgi:type IV pilus assembly protein PilC